MRERVLSQARRRSHARDSFSNNESDVGSWNEAEKVPPTNPTSVSNSIEETSSLVLPDSSPSVSVSFDGLPVMMVEVEASDPHLSCSTIR